MASQALVPHTPSWPAIYAPVARAQGQMERLILSTERLVMVMMRASQINLVQAKSQQIVVNQQIVNVTQSIKRNFGQITTSIAQSNVALNQTGVEITKAADKQKELNKQAENGRKSFEKLMSSIKKTVSKIASMKNIKSAMAFSDNYMNSLARIDTVNDGTQSNEQLQAKIIAAASRSRGRYFEMTDLVARLGLTAPKAFTSNDEMVAFAELSQKALRLGGIGATKQQDAMEKLVQGMAGGGLKGNDFTTIMESAPILAEAIARFTGKSKEELISMSAEGKITADIIKGALFTAANDINKKFDQMPRSFGDIWNQISTLAINSFGPVIERASQLLNSDQIQKIIARIVPMIQLAADLIGGLIDGIGTFAGMILENWSSIEPILIAVGTVWLGMIIAQLWAMIPPLLAQVASWVLMNAPIVLIGLAIAMLIRILTNMGVTTEQIIGAVTGFFYGLYAFIYNIFADLDNSISRFGEFLKNVFHHPIYSIKRLFGDLALSILDNIRMVAEAIDWVFGSDLTGHLDSFQKKIEDWIGDMPDGYKVSQRIEKKSIVEEMKKGYNTGSNFVENLSSKLSGLELDNMLQYDKLLKNQPDQLLSEEDNKWLVNDYDKGLNVDKVNEVGRIGDTVDISSEDLKMMRELAEMNAIQNFVSLTPTVNVQTGDIRNGYDVDTIIARIEQSLTDQIASSAQGVYGLG